MVLSPDGNIFHKEQIFRSISFNNWNKFLHALLLKWKTHNPDHNIFEIHNFFVQAWYATSKMKFDN